MKKRLLQFGISKYFAVNKIAKIFTILNILKVLRYPYPAR